MTEYDNTNRGVLFKNDRKESDKHPDYKGNLNVNGAEFWLDAWIKKSRDGSKTFMSVSVKPKNGGGKTATRDDPPPPREPDPNDEMPF